MKTKYLSLVAILILIMVPLLLLGCSKQQSTATTAPAAQTAKTLKIGVVLPMGTDVGVDGKRAIELMAESDNKAGGVDIGGEKYNVQLIEYDNQGSQTGETSATNRLVFEDKVPFIITIGQFQGAWIKTTEANKVIVMTLDMNPTTSLTPDLHYSFNSTTENTQIYSISGWFVKNYPDLTKNLVLTAPDNQFGHLIATMEGAIFNAFGVKPTNLFFPPTQTDLSSLGSKVVSLNPGALTSGTGDNNLDGNIYKTVRNAGYKGQFFGPSQGTAQTLLQMIPGELLEGYISGAYPTEFAPALTDAAKSFKNGWIAKYGEWTGPTIVNSASYSCLIAAIKQAGTLDTDKVSSVIANGLKFSSPLGDEQMISRPDLGNNRTVDSISTFYVKQIKNSKATLLATIGIEEALGYFKTVTAAMGPPGGAPPGGAPPPGGPPSGPPPTTAP